MSTYSIIVLEVSSLCCFDSKFTFGFDAQFLCTSAFKVLFVNKECSLKQLLGGASYLPQCSYFLESCFFLLFV